MKKIQIQNQLHYYEADENGDWVVVRPDCTSDVVSEEVASELDELWDCRDDDDTEVIVVSEFSL
jgi:hydrogenase maturation factor